MELMAACAYGLLPQMTSQEVVVLMSALARHNHRPQGPWMTAMLQASQPLLPRMPPRALAQLVQALGTLAHRPPAPWLAMLLESSQASMAYAGPHDVAALLWGLAMLDVQPPVAWMAACVGRAHALLRQQVAAQEAGAAARGSSAAAAGGEGSGREADQGSGRETAEGALAGLESPLREGVLRAGGTLAPNPLASKGGPLSVRNRAARMVSEWDARALSRFIWGLARMRYQPGPEVMGDFMQAAATLRAAAPSSPSAASLSLATPTPAAAAVARTAGLPADSVASQPVYQQAVQLQQEQQHHLQRIGASRQAGLGSSSSSGSEDEEGEGAQASAATAATPDFSVFVLQGLASWAAARLGYPLPPGVLPRQNRTSKQPQQQVQEAGGIEVAAPKKRGRPVGSGKKRQAEVSSTG